LLSSSAESAEGPLFSDAGATKQVSVLIGAFG